MKKTTQPKIGVSVLTLLPYAFGPGGPSRAAHIAHHAGLTGLQLVPLRSWSIEAIKHLAQASVLSYENSWKSLDGSRGKLDRALFGDANAIKERTDAFYLLFPDALGVDLCKWNSLVEVSPTHSVYEEDYFSQEQGVVLDLWHLFDTPLITRNPELFVDRLVNLNRIKMVHIQTRDKEEFDLFMHGKPTRMGRLLKRVAMLDVPFIMEFDPRWFLVGMHHKLIIARVRILDILGSPW